jgi:hypothetical protein
VVVDCDSSGLWPHVVRLLGRGCSTAWQQSRPLSIPHNRLIRQRAASSVSLLSRLSCLTGSFLIEASSQSVGVTAAGFSGAELATLVHLTIDTL